MQEIFNKIKILNIELFNFKDEKIDISRIFLKIDIFENIFEFFLTGKLVIVDTQDLIANFPIIGNEKLKISLQHEDKNIDLLFRIYKIESDISNTRGIQKNKTFILYFCSDEKLKSLKISRKYHNKSETIIQNLITNNLKSDKNFLFKSTSEEITVLSNFWDFQKIVEYIIRISKSNEYFDYMFFETLEKLNFLPVSYLLKEEPTEKIIYDIDNLNFLKNDNIKIFRFNKYFNILEDQSFGLFGKTLYKYHDTNYSYFKTEKNITDIYEKITSLGKNIPFDVNLFQYTEKIDNNFYDPEISIIRTTIMNILQHYNIIIRINGTLNRSIGQIIDLQYPKVYNDEIIQQSFGGNWFIMGIHHIILNDGDFEQNILLSKNAKFDFKNLEETKGNKNI